MDFDASEMKSLSVDLNNVPKKFGHLARTVVRKTAKDIERDAKITAPRDPARPPQDLKPRVTGNLRNQIRTSDLRSMGISGTIGADVTASAEYSRWQEEGTSTMPARPFMGPALVKHTPSFEEAMGMIAEQAIGEM